MLCFGHVAAHFLSKRFYILGTCIIFHQIMFLKELLAFRALHSIQGAFILFRALLFHSERFNYCVWSNIYPRSAFIFPWSAFINGALLFFLQSAFLFLHSAFLILHSASLKFSVLCQHLYIFPFVSQRAIYLFWYSYYFNS